MQGITHLIVLGFSLGEFLSLTTLEYRGEGGSCPFDFLIDFLIFTHKLCVLLLCWWCDYYFFLFGAGVPISVVQRPPCYHYPE